MSRTRGLKILQYNVQRRKDAVMAPLLESKEVKDMDVLAIQEPARNLMNKTSYNPSTSRFHLAHGGDPEARTCFYINKRIEADSWGVEYQGSDLCSLWIQIKRNQNKTEAGRAEGQSEEKIWIHNVYNPSPVSYTSMDSPTTILKLDEAMDEDGEHIVVGDFNLHHPLWNNPGRTTYHAMADELLEVVGKRDMELGLPEKVITWQNRGSQSAIDLIFLTGRAHDALVKCGIREDLDMGSDHLPIITELEWNWNECQIRQRRAWKRIEIEATKQEIQGHARVLNIVMERYLVNTEEAIDLCVEKLITALQEIIEETIPYKEPYEGAKSYWNLACSKTTLASRAALKAYRHSRNVYTEATLHQANHKKTATLRKARMFNFREGVHKASLKPGGVWRLAKWGRERSIYPKELPQFPAIKDGSGGKAADFDGKVRALRRVLFPPPPQADLADIEGARYPKPIATNSQITEKEVKEAIWHPGADKAPGISGIPNRFLRAVCTEMLGTFKRIFQACLDHGYHPRKFREANTIVLKKPKKADYSEPKAYRPIALLDTLGKALETVIARRLSGIAETNHLLPEHQMGGRKRRSVETALETITDSVHTIWNQGRNNVASLLSLDVAGAFDNVSHERLLHNLRVKGVPKEITQWTSSFLRDRATSITLGGKTSPIEAVETGIPQGSPISPILFLFFNAPLIEACAKAKIPVQVGGFVDDIHLLAYSKSTETNCRWLEQAHKICLRWAKTHGATFAPQKYELVHLSRTPKKFNMEETVRFNSTEILPSASIRVLGLHIDTKLRWGPHIAQIKAKATTQVRAIKCLAGSTWGATFEKCRTVYSMAIRPMLTFAAPIWHTPTEKPGQVGKNTRTLATIQNDCLRTALGAYRATPVQVLEAEATIPPIQNHLDRLVMKHQAFKGIHPLTIEGNRAIRRRLKGKRGKARPQHSTPSQEKEAWALQELEANDWDQASTTIRRKAHWHDPEKDVEEYQDMNVLDEKIQNWARIKRAEQWKAYINTTPEYLRTPAQRGPLNEGRGSYHRGLRKAESSIAVQLRSGKNGLRHFLYKAKVPGVDSARCSCGWGKQDAKHILLYCPKLSSTRRELLKEAGTHNIRAMLSRPTGIRAAARWMVRTGYLTQYQLAKEQLSQSKLPLQAEPMAKTPKTLKKKKPKCKEKLKAAELPECCRAD